MKIPWSEITHGRTLDNFGENLSGEIYTEKLAEDANLRPTELCRYPALLAPLGKYDYVYNEHITTIIGDYSLNGVKINL
jgi:hypothetical protein